MQSILQDYDIYEDILRDLGSNDWKVFKQKKDITVKYKFEENNALTTYSECVIEAPFRNILFMFTEYDYYP